jgi:hypothetical protein
LGASASDDYESALAVAPRKRRGEVKITQVASRT